MLVSRLNWSGRTVNGVTLGEPVTMGNGMYGWDGGVPDGEIMQDGSIVTSEVGDLVEPRLAPEVPPVSAVEKDAGVAEITVSAETGDIEFKNSKGKVVSDDERAARKAARQQARDQAKTVAVEVVGDVPVG